MALCRQCGQVIVAVPIKPLLRWPPCVKPAFSGPHVWEHLYQQAGVLPEHRVRVREVDDIRRRGHDGNRATRGRPTVTVLMYSTS
jgi:hypothetical protein